MGASTWISRCGAGRTFQDALADQVLHPAGSLLRRLGREEEKIPASALSLPLTLLGKIGICPWLMRWALVMIIELAAWRKITTRRVTGAMPLAITSRSTSPAPTEGSWSTSPTKPCESPAGQP